MKLKVVVSSTIISIFTKDDSLSMIIIVIDFPAPTVPHALMEWQLLLHYYSIAASSDITTAPTITATATTNHPFQRRKTQIQKKVLNISPNSFPQSMIRVISFNDYTQIKTALVLNQIPISHTWRVTTQQPFSYNQKPKK